ncbi:CBS domain-containing protein [Natronolimnohabitans sp. A-GB9]|uniref:CBS domain-containing protein n=1 Tax=Natronolimnohabitans sp. A-GB9 TaxID=3069757 RepID=UPI0027B549B0|nr:CBS domain-containing protein [Natronolimnohabitans sp. A-GB9]MDQ2050891.1 CBS domain-containing protein [Natronolimnohabitans sp. A-GB9]
MHRTIPVSEIMVTDVVTAPPNANATQAATLLRDEGVSSVVVADDDVPVGIVTEGDFATRLCTRADLGDVALADVMSSPLETIAPDTSIVDAVDALRDDSIEHLPVVEDDGTQTDTKAEANGELVGILTTTELTYYVPHLAHRSGGLEEKPPRQQVRTDTQYEHDDWEFEYRGEDESTVSVGDVARFTKSITANDVETFAEVSGDTNRLHLDEGYAAGTRFGEPIAHGVLANGLVSAALARLPGLTIYLSQESSFLAPLSIGDRATAVCEIVDDLGGEKYRIETIVTDGDGTTVLEGDAVVLIDELPPEATDGESVAVD